MTKIRRFALGLLASTVVASSDVAASELVAERIQKLTRAVRWRPLATIPINFKTHHPQGMVKIGDTFFVSSVEITVPTTRFPEPKDGYDRDTGQGAGHLFKIDAKGILPVQSDCRAAGPANYGRSPSTACAVRSSPSRR